MEDLEAIEEQRMDVIQELADLERERDKEANKLRRRARQTILRINFSQLEEGYARVKEIHNRFTSKREDWIELLGTKEDGEPTYPQRGTPESRYNPDNRDLARKTSYIADFHSIVKSVSKTYKMSKLETAMASNPGSILFILSFPDRFNTLSLTTAPSNIFLYELFTTDIYIPSLIQDYCRRWREVGKHTNYGPRLLLQWLQGRRLYFE